MLTLCALKHLILTCIAIAGKMANVGDVHNSGNLVTDVSKIFLKHVLHSIGTKVADVCKMIYGRTAGIHCYLALFSGNKLIFSSCSRIV